MDFRNQNLIEAERLLILQASKGSLEAFNQLVLNYQDIAYNSAYALVGDPALAEDITQDSFIKAFRDIRNFRGGIFRAWLLIIVKNTAYDFLRQSKRHPTQSLITENDEGEEYESPSWIVDHSQSVEAMVEQSEDASRINQMIDELPEIFRTVLTMIDLYEMDYEEAAQIIGVPMGTVKSRLARARLQMREKLLSDSQYFRHFDMPIPIGQA